MMKKILSSNKKLKRICFCLILTMFLSLTLSSCNQKSESKTKKTTFSNSITVLNYGKYIDENMIKKFEKETGIHVKYEEYESPEEMYTKYKSGSINYDIICTSEYIIQKLMSENEIKKTDFTTLKNYHNIDPKILEINRSFDRKNEYALPYFYGTLGILYDKTKVSSKDVQSWDCLWNKKYNNEIIMENSVRDTFAAALKKLNYSINDTNKKHLEKALYILERQKKHVYAYMVDETADEMIAGNAKLALCYSGEAATAMDSKESLAYSIPKEGSNVWVDSWFIPKSCKNEKNAMMFLDFICREDVATANFDYVYYASPILPVVKKQPKDVLNNEAVFPSKETLKNCEIFTMQDQKTTNYYSDLWMKLKAY
ncbi:spermidine/putrescine transport system substrate-binding protein [Lachnobacterium bovis]|uniref:Spermidine/putrescine transport system substrate-binding protein n=2 Tax=Lachnobacterium bovis TaxID=140626 RepID=A0A1H9PUW1_9FIRM|nr:spermidine/putrescine transport system substrate-binding protein [Lachnobacterium bovis]